MKRTLINWGGVLTLLLISFNAKAHQFTFSSNHQLSHLLPGLASISLTKDDISDKLAADIRFIELIKVELSFQSKFRSLSTEDKKLFLAALKEKNTSKMLVLFTKCRIDFKDYISTRTSILKVIYKDYDLDKRSDKEQIIKAAVAKLDPPTFAECLALWASGYDLCYLAWSNNENALLACYSLVMASYLACLSELP